VRKGNSWLERQPLWLYSPIMFALSFLIWTLMVYADAWLAEGHQIIRGYLGFPDGRFSVPEALMAAAIWAVAMTAGHLWRKQRQTRPPTEA
jgi:hypothetical protein